MFVSEPEHDTDQLRGYGKKTRGLSVPVGTKVSGKMGGVDFSALVIIAGATRTPSGTTPNQVSDIRFPAGGQGMGYFGVIGVSATDTGGVAVIGHAAVMLDAIPKWTMDGEANKFNVSEFAGYSYPQNDDLFVLKPYETASDWDMPTTGEEFAAFFA